MNRFDEVILGAIGDGIFPGACYGVWKDGRLTTGAVGRFTYDSDSTPVTLETVWDLASLSKVIGTTTAFMMLYQDGAIGLDQSVSDILPEFGVNGKEKITFRNLMVHDSGLVAFRPYQETCKSPGEVMDAIYKEELTYVTGSQSVYSDLSMIVVARAIERISGQSLDVFLRDQVFAPLGMCRTGYFDHLSSSFIEPVDRGECAPTEVIEPWRMKMRKSRYGKEGSERTFGRDPTYIQGEVHDPTAAMLGGVAGHAGLFSTVEDLCLYLVAFLAKHQTLVKSDVFSMFTTRQSEGSTRALGWDTKSPVGSSAGSTFGFKSFGHTGYTGTSIWCDPEATKFSLLLTNRVHPTSKNTKILAFRAKFNEQT